MMDSRFGHLMQQRTLASSIAFVGIGLHTGKRVTMQLRGAPADNGITVSRLDLPADQRRFVLRPEYVVGGRSSLTLVNSHGHRVTSLGNVLSALYGLGVDNVHVELNGPEAPILDGSAQPIVSACRNVGITALGVTRDLLVIRQPVRLQRGDRWAELRPDLAPGINVAIADAHPDIGYQHLATHLTPGIYASQIAPARTFGFAEQAWHLQAPGLMPTGDASNAILLGEVGIANPDELRFGDEFARRAALDALAALSIAGATIIGELRAFQCDLGLIKQLLQLALSHKPSTGRIPATILFSGPESDEEADSKHAAAIDPA